MAFEFNPLTNQFNIVKDRFKRLSFDRASTLSAGPGQLTWNQEEETLDVGLERGAILQLGQEQHYHVENNTLLDIPQGTPVQFANTVGNSGKLRIEPWDGSKPSFTFMGIATTDIAPEGLGYVTSFGKVRGIQTDGANYGETWSDGDILYAKQGGGLTKILPTAPDPKIVVAAVINAHHSNGAIFVRPIVGSSLLNDELVEINENVKTGDILRYNNNRFENYNPYSVSIMSSSGTVILSEFDGSYILLDTQGANIDVILPTTTIKNVMTIKNKDTLGTITVNYNGTPLKTLNPNETGRFLFEGLIWEEI